MALSDNQLDEIRAMRADGSATLRPTVPALEEILFEPIRVLDHGFLRVIDYMGDDAAVVQAARVSYGRGTKKVSEDRGLIMYLMRHWHTTPFEMAEIKFHVKLPIFVARQWIRHRTASINEYSARYSILDKEFYIPDEEHLAAQSTANRQGRGEILTGDEAARVLEMLRSDAEKTYADYAWMLNENPDSTVADANRAGLARELARMNLTLNTYTQWYWKTNLHNLMHFLRLRADVHAQYEIRVYAEKMLDVLRRWTPLTYDAFVEYRLGSVSLSRTALNVVKKLIAGEKVTPEASGLSPREWRELMHVLSEADAQK
ncbi:FAD-dependent thymidylate synthase [Rhodoblastus acidophilus]|uniref:Flavin-dependent thymidylate synthase n=1 Tax=Candidatus Rhodoblastus alkanivorans TaxID=2954117 RepID=A0ABS9Z746_9HYPH|nr:FAD-dependent thymidylate synthase [Candidatus Rhodoblastus alkanivorans]MCI4678436.1 FAD-dependent thymidylate synthase [Candidatus Rhodoblastus alkanivorans]MCI4682891.1 FAD-dependent thymidylate synthase [Candidatus Rhodoblastus alkanivorans]MDI4640200.1 FAD-dependent thymidylate synthase [Rhodoblastus acidophilus]